MQVHSDPAPPQRFKYGPVQSAEEFDLVALLAILWRGKWWIMLAGVIGIVVAGYCAFRVATPLYPARVTIALEAEGQSQVIGDIEIEVLRSRSLIAQLLDELDLTQDPDFNGEGRRPGPIARLRMATSDWTPRQRTGEALRNSVIDAMIARISICNIRQSLAFNLQIQTTDPQRSADIVNALARIDVENSVRRKLDGATRDDMDLRDL